MNKLVYGKADTKNIVSMEIIDSTTELFIQQTDGSVKSEFVENKFWVLSSHNPGNWKKLDGNLHYQFGKQFITREDFLKTRQQLKHLDIYSIYDPKESFMVLKGHTYFKGMKHTDPSILSFDIETTGLDLNPKTKLLLISNTFRKNGQITKRLFSFTDYLDEGEMLIDWCKWVREMDPTVLCGHNINIFDLPFINYKADEHGISLDLGRNGSRIKFQKFESKFRKDQTQDLHYHKAHIYGREIIDTFFLAIKYDIASKKYESYGLKKIIAQEGLEKKNRTFYDASSIRKNYLIPSEWEKIKEYCKDDSDDALALYDLMIPPFFYSAQNVPKSFQAILESATGSQFNSMMIRSYLQNGHSLPKESNPVDYEGAISIGNPGIFSNVFKIDVASLYPSIVLQYEVYNKEKDPNANFLKIMQYFTEDRLKNKKLANETNDNYYKNLEQTSKIFINSGYGFLGATGLLFNSPKHAAFITKKGREILNQAMEWSKTQGFTLVNADTDSISFSKGDSSFISENERIRLLDSINSLFPGKIKFIDDGYYNKLICVKAKNYILYDGKKIKTKGSALRATGKERALQQFIQDIINTIINDQNNYTDIYHSYIKEALNIKDITRWVSKKTVTDKVLNPERTNELKVKNAIENSEYMEGDKIYVFFDNEDNLRLAEHFNGDYNKSRLLGKLYKTAQVFSTILDTKVLFPNYSLKRNKELLANL